MQIDTLDSGCVRIRLSPEEADSYQLRQSRMDEEDPAVRRFLREMLDEASKQADFLLRTGRLLAQAYTARDGSVTLFLSVLGNLSPTSGEPILVRFETVDDMLSAMLGLFTLHCHRVLDSSLYRLNGRFYAVIRPLSDSGTVAGFLSEYGELTGRGNAKLAFLAEHGERVIVDNAMDVVTYYFS